MPLELPRRGFLLGLLAAIAAPAVVRAQSLMPVRAVPPALLRPAPLLVQRLRIESMRLKNAACFELASVQLRLSDFSDAVKHSEYRTPLKGVRDVKVTHNVGCRPIYAVGHSEPVMIARWTRYTDGMIECDLSSSVLRVHAGDYVEISYPIDGGPAAVDVIKSGQVIWDAQVDRHARADGTVDIEGFNAESSANARKLGAS